MTDGLRRPLVVVLGGGFTGAAVAYHLVRRIGRDAARIMVIEPRETLGAGLAYSTPEPAHRINVPAAKMSLDSAEPEQFARWLEAANLPDDDPAAFEARGVFPQRRVFARYVAAMLAPFLADGRIVHRRTRAERVARVAGGRFEIGLRDGLPVAADILVLATTHPLPAVPEPLRPIATAPGFLADPYDIGALGRVPRDARVLVLGNGLTAADTVATLDRLGHRGPIVSLSRHGLRSRGHSPFPVEAFGDFAAEPSSTALALLRRIRRTVERAAEAGVGWHAVLDAVRNQGGAIWQGLPEAQQRRLVRRLRASWDVHRFRIAPQVEAVLDRLTAEGRLRTFAASLHSARETLAGIEVVFRQRGAASPRIETFDRVVNTTGPAHRDVIAAEPARSLHAAGLLRLDAVGLGLATAEDGRAIDLDGRLVPNLFVAGPLARGTFGELMGLLEVTRYAEFVAAQIAAATLRLATKAERSDGEFARSG
ncbi:FAD/NAD(P)-binding protein [Aureimonas leprariae]|uniref:NAD(P)-binding protein n=1 Tax=Plantimonas leprariae TaxID=2615207 RepID=A0A7V7PN95_9HYPH|nr:FAD/NAD(P)-binding protein [Aureimonas leprariae]KAB0679097.1 NAD(P)-binding protein [Aureimonas leprariae]